MSEFNKLQAEMLGQESDEFANPNPDEAKPKDESEIDKSAQPSEQPKVDDRPAPAVETPDEEQPEQPKTEDDPYVKTFREQGLDRMFKTPLDVFASVRQQNRYITQLEQERIDLRRQLDRTSQTSTPKSAVETVTPDDFINDPVRAVDRMGLAKREEVQQQNNATMSRIEQLEQALETEKFFQIIDSEPELKGVSSVLRSGGRSIDNAFWNAVNDVFVSHPVLRRLPESEALPICIEAARGRFTDTPAAKHVAPASIPAPSPTITRAVSTGGKPSKAAPVEPDWDKLSAAKIVEKIGYADS